MEIINSLENYTIAQKSIGVSLLATGILVLCISVIIHFTNNQHSLFSGIKVAGFMMGLFLILSGSAYRYKYCDEIQEKASTLYEKDRSEFISSEIKRMEKVASNYPLIKIVIGCLIIAGIVLLFLIQNYFIHGLIYTTSIALIGILIIEAISNISIIHYLKELSILRL